MTPQPLPNSTSVRYTILTRKGSKPMATVHLPTLHLNIGFTGFRYHGQPLPPYTVVDAPVACRRCACGGQHVGSSAPLANRSPDGNRYRIEQHGRCHHPCARVAAPSITAEQPRPPPSFRLRPESRTAPTPVIPAQEQPAPCLTRGHPALDTGPESRAGPVVRRSARANLAHQCANTLSGRSADNLTPRTRSQPNHRPTGQRRKPGQPPRCRAV